MTTDETPTAPKEPGAILADERNDAADAAYNAALEKGKSEQLAQRDADAAAHRISEAQTRRGHAARMEALAAGKTPEEAEAAVLTVPGQPLEPFIDKNAIQPGGGR